MSIALQKDGKIICGGSNIQPYFCLLARYNTDGSSDKTFGNKGIVETIFTKLVDYYKDIVIQYDDKIVAVGTARSNDFADGKPPLVAVARYNSDGSLDETFDKDGKTTFAFGTYDYGTSVALQPDGKIVVFGTAGNKTFDYGVARLNADGSLDAGFGTDGITITAIADDAQDQSYQVALQSTGNIIVSGFTQNKENKYSNVLTRYIGGSKDNVLPVAKIKTWLYKHAVKWLPVYTSGNIDFYAIEKSKSRNAGFTEVKRFQAENLPQPQPVTDQAVTYAYNLAANATANAATPSYYRIRAVYNNGSSVYSNVVSDSLLIQNDGVTFSPNPVKNAIKITGLAVNQQSTINIISRNGNVLQTATGNSSIYNINIGQLKAVFILCRLSAMAK